MKLFKSSEFRILILFLVAVVFASVLCYFWVDRKIIDRRHEEMLELLNAESLSNDEFNRMFFLRDYLAKRGSLSRFRIRTDQSVDDQVFAKRVQDFRKMRMKGDDVIFYEGPLSGSNNTEYEIWIDPHNKSSFLESIADWNPVVE